MRPVSDRLDDLGPSIAYVSWSLHFKVAELAGQLQTSISDASISLATCPWCHRMAAYSQHLTEPGSAAAGGTSLSHHHPVALGLSRNVWVAQIDTDTRRAPNLPQVNGEWVGR